MIDGKNIDVDWQETRRFLEKKYFSKIRELSKKYDYPCENIAIDFNWVFGLIEKIEQQPKTDWIPCEVDMPKKKGYYQCIVFRYEEDEHNVFDLWFEDGEWYIDEIGEDEEDMEEKYFIHEVIAWQPLPAPYKK